MSTPTSEIIASAAWPHAQDGLQQPDGVSDERVTTLGHLRLYLLVDAEDGRPT
jgi:hypothetical protein